MADLIAASEDGTWFAYPRDGMTRGQAMARVASSADDIGYGDWWDTLHRFKVLAGFVVESEEEPERGWWSECDEDTPGAVRAWIVRSRG